MHGINSKRIVESDAWNTFLKELWKVMHGINSKRIVERDAWNKF